MTNSQPRPDALSHFRHIAHADGRLEATSEIVSDIQHPVASKSGRVNWRKTAEGLAQRVAEERAHSALLLENANAITRRHRAKVEVLEEEIETLQGDLSMFQHLTQWWGFFLLPRVIKDLF